jgi:hypothetical protein
LAPPCKALRSAAEGQIDYAIAKTSPPFDIEGVGRIAILADSTGAMLGWMTAEMAEGDEEDEEDDETEEEAKV